MSDPTAGSIRRGASGCPRGAPPGCARSSAAIAAAGCAARASRASPRDHTSLRTEGEDDAARGLFEWWRAPIGEAVRRRAGRSLAGRAVFAWRRRVLPRRGRGRARRLSGGEGGRPGADLADGRHPARAGPGAGEVPRHRHELRRACQGGGRCRLRRLALPDLVQQAGLLHQRSVRRRGEARRNRRGGL